MLLNATRLWAFAMAALYLGFIGVADLREFALLSRFTAFALAGIFFLVHLIGVGAIKDRKVELLFHRGFLLVPTLMAIQYSPFETSTGSIGKWAALILGWMVVLVAPYTFSAFLSDNEDSRKAGQLVLGGGGASIALVGCLIFMGNCSVNSSAANREPQVVKAQETTTGSVVTLSQDTIICFTDAAWDSMADDDVMKVKIMNGEAGLLSKGTRVKVSDVHFASRSIIPLDGSYAGRTGRVPYELVR